MLSGLLDFAKPLHGTFLSLPGAYEISYESLKELLASSQNLFLVDVRTKEEVDKGRIEGSVHIPGEIFVIYRGKKVKIRLKYIKHALLSHTEHQISFYPTVTSYSSSELSMLLCILDM